MNGSASLAAAAAAAAARARQDGACGAGAQGKDGQRRPMFRRRKVCKFCAEKIDDINYKDAVVDVLVPERAKIRRGAFRAPARCTSASCAPSCEPGSLH
jgi:ribosomal protein S18